MSGGSRFFVERGGEDQGTQKKNPEMSNTAAGKARRGAQVSASSEVGDVADLPRAHGGGRGDAVPGGDGPARASRRVCRAGAGRPAACPKPRWRAFGADAPPLLRSRKGGNDIRRTLHFSHFARGGVGAGALSGAAGALARGLRESTHPSVSVPPESTFPMAWCSSFASKGAVAMT